MTTRWSDTQLKEAIDDELIWTAGINSANIGVAVSHGAVTLSGEVDSFPQKHLAEQVALKVHGVTAVAEEITVRNTWSEVNDTDIAREALEALDRSVDVPSGSVKAVVNHHCITLSGALPWQYQREAAHRAVRYLKGVTAVDNTITLRPTVSPHGIKNAIAGSLSRNAQLEGRGLTVTAEEGNVVLEGRVHSWYERRQADVAAWSAPGVTSVTNHIRVAD